MNCLRFPAQTRRTFPLSALLTAFYILASTVSLSSQDRTELFRDFIVDVEEAARVHSVIVTVRFKEARLGGEYVKKGSEFIFVSDGTGLRVFFKSEKLGSLHSRLNDDAGFRDFISRSRIFGVDNGNNSLEGRVLLGGICHDKNCTDEDFVVIHAD